MKKLKLNIEGMHCKSCAFLIQDDLENLGAEEVSVSHETGIVKVSYDETKLNESKIKNVIRKGGYKIK